MKILGKLLGFVLLVVVVGGAGFCIGLASNAGKAVQDAGTDITEKIESAVSSTKNTGEVVSKVMKGEDLTDSELQSALGIDEETYSTLKEAAAQAGVDVNDSTQLKEVASANMDKMDELKDIADKVESGSLSAEEASALIKRELTIPSGK